MYMFRLTLFNLQGWQRFLAGCGKTHFGSRRRTSGAAGIKGLCGVNSCPSQNRRKSGFFAACKAGVDFCGSHGATEQFAEKVFVESRANPSGLSRH
jgi:hypothetical protein